MFLIQEHNETRLLSAIRQIPLCKSDSGDWSANVLLWLKGVGGLQGQSALKDLAGCQMRISIAHDCLENLQTLFQQNDVVLSRMSPHSGNQGNELVERLARFSRSQSFQGPNSSAELQKQVKVMDMSLCCHKLKFISLNNDIWLEERISLAIVRENAASIRSSVDSQPF